MFEALLFPSLRRSCLNLPSRLRPIYARDLRRTRIRARVVADDDDDGITLRNGVVRESSCKGTILLVGQFPNGLDLSFDTTRE